MARLERVLARVAPLVRPGELVALVDHDDGSWEGGPGLAVVVASEDYARLGVPLMEAWRAEGGSRAGELVSLLDGRVCSLGRADALLLAGTSRSPNHVERWRASA